MMSFSGLTGRNRTLFPVCEAGTVPSNACVLIDDDITSNLAKIVFFVGMHVCVRMYEKSYIVP